MTSHNARGQRRVKPRPGASIPAVANVFEPDPVIDTRSFDGPHPERHGA